MSLVNFKLGGREYIFLVFLWFLYLLKKSSICWSLRKDTFLDLKVELVPGWEATQVRRDPLSFSPRVRVLLINSWSAKPYLKSTITIIKYYNSLQSTCSTVSHNPCQLSNTKDKSKKIFYIHINFQVQLKKGNLLPAHPFCLPALILVRSVGGDNLAVQEPGQGGGGVAEDLEKRFKEDWVK